MTPKNTICLWFDNDAHEAARFYAATFPDSRVTAVHKAPADYPGGKAGDELTVEFTVVGIPCLGLNGGPAFKHSEAFSFQIATDTQEETDRYWNAIVGNGGQESACGWCKDRWGLSWQITPRALTDALAAGGAEARRAFEAMLTMKKIDIATIEAALSRTWMRVLIALELRGESYPREIAQLLGVSLSVVQKAIRSLELDGRIAGRSVGRTRLYSLNPRYFAATEPFPPWR